MPSIKLLTTVILAGMSLAMQTGCASYVALRMPGPSNDKRVEIGMHRAEVESLLRGAPATSQFEEDEETIVRYEYSDGPNQASKVRTLLYVAGDVFTLFLSELIFWPIELYATDEIKRNATATYDSNNSLADWKVQRRSNGETLAFKTRDPASVAANREPEKNYSSIPLHRVAIGYSKIDVESNLGIPVNVIGSKLYDDGTTVEVWSYERWHSVASGPDYVEETYWLYFYNGELVQWGRPGDWQRQSDQIYEVRVR